MAAPTPRTIINLKPAVQVPRRRRYLIFFVTGNPGLIEFYFPFLQQLHRSLQKRVPDASFEVFGRSLSGFEVDDATARGHGYPASVSGTGARTPPFGLEAQIEGVEWSLWDHVRGVVEEGRRESEVWREERPRVVVVGHSVGAYIALEVCRRWREGPGSIVGCVGLFPTVVDIAKSSNGKKFSILLAIPNFPLIANFLVQLLTFWIPMTWLSALVRLATGNQSAAAAATIAAFIKSGQGVRRALHMAADELNQITTDSWDSEIWGAAAASSLAPPRPKLYFLFGQKDQWVADETRDELIRARGRGRGRDGEEVVVEGEGKGKTAESWKPVMEVDGEGVGHGFCLGE
ncbi:hypothetical protein K490DRAFT_43145 [Saccharata proteae CBS 121410]|uniref:Uncharacterized protein n=1 Tax=Saccharata proteae CBS 121410 TaxID=1314787 RepID=A0A9P4LY76_9PEZI|nr:hypothetical protein K490DRAFT_43145 [Saccharata proteae CBS 121410]